MGKTLVASLNYDPYAVYYRIDILQMGYPVCRIQHLIEVDAVTPVNGNYFMAALFQPAFDVSADKSAGAGQ
jgi:hypothetical protein